MTIHGKSNYPGLYIWLRTGERRAARIPDGCLLLQASKILEHLTAGYFEASYHEIIVSEDTLKKLKTQKEKGESTWRVSSNLFMNLDYDLTMKPLNQFKSLVKKSSLILF